MDYEDGLPNLDHWRAVMEFTVEQAALLMAMIDPFDIQSLDEAKERQVPRWKKAHAHSLAIISAIRQGVISPVVCCAYFFEGDQWNGDWTIQHIKPADRHMEISPKHTIITRASLQNWIATERVQITRPKPLRTTVRHRVMEAEAIEAAPAPLALPYHGHKSEGLEFVDEAIKQLWSTYDEDDPNTAPTREEVVNFLREKGAGANMAEAVNLILRPRGLRKSRLKNNKVPTRES